MENYGTLPGWTSGYFFIFRLKGIIVYFVCVIYCRPQYALQSKLTGPDHVETQIAEDQHIFQMVYNVRIGT